MAYSIENDIFETSWSYLENRRARRAYRRQEIEYPVVTYNRAVCRVMGEFAYVNHWEGPTEPAPPEVPARAKDYYSPCAERLKIRNKKRRAV